MAVRVTDKGKGIGGRRVDHNKLPSSYLNDDQCPITVGPDPTMWHNRATFTSQTDNHYLIYCYPHSANSQPDNHSRLITYHPYTRISPLSLSFN